jgi:hypothetical protein
MLHAEIESWALQLPGMAVMTAMAAAYALYRSAMAS